MKNGSQFQFSSNLSDLVVFRSKMQRRFHVKLWNFWTHLYFYNDPLSYSTHEYTLAKCKQSLASKVDDFVGKISSSCLFFFLLCSAVMWSLGEICVRIICFWMKIMTCYNGPKECLNLNDNGALGRSNSVNQTPKLECLVYNYCVPSHSGHAIHRYNK